MKPCPWCGRNNLDSDEYCFNCERDLNAAPGPEEEAWVEEEIRRIRVRKPPSLVRLVFLSLLRKAMYGLLALGGFFIVALVAIWVSYDNTVVALAALALLCLSVLLSVYGPDARLSRRIGMRGVLVSALTNLIILGVCVPPSLWFLRHRGYIAGVLPFLAHTWWAFAAFPVLGCLISWLAGRKAPAETAAP